MKNITLLLGIIFSVTINAQAPILYVQIVSHNEPTDNLQQPLNYQLAKSNALTMANIVDSKNAKWNLQTSDGFVFGARMDQVNTGTNIFSTLASAPYNDNIQIDPRSKNFPGRNIADQYWLLDSLGANPSQLLGGCIYAVSTPYTNADIDWEQYRDTIHGLATPGVYKCSLITGAGSLPPHSNDLYDFGCFKPDTLTNFYVHNPNKNLWCLGVGCAPVLDSLDDQQAIIDLIQAELDSIQNGWWPQNKFYNMRIMTNQREYGPMFFTKISQVIDSINAMNPAQIQWATMGEAFNAFQAWETSSGLDHSQWQCGETMNAVADPVPTEEFTVYPNPSTGEINIQFNDHNDHAIEMFDDRGALIYSGNSSSQTTTQKIEGRPGLYLIRIDGTKTIRVIKQE